MEQELTPDHLDRDSLQREVVTLRKRVSDLQRQLALYSGSATEKVAGLEVTLSERQQLLVEAERIAQVGSWIWNIETDQVFWSDELYRILGYDPAKDRASTENFFAAVHPEDRARVQEESARGVGDGVSRQVDYRVLRADGTLRHVTMDGAMLFDETGKLRRLVGTVRDITELRRLQERLIQAEKMEAIGRLAGGVAHDFNNLLMVIGANLELRGGEENDELRPAMRALQSARRLTSRLLAFGRQSVLQREFVDLNSLVERALQLVRRAVRDGIALVVELDDARPHLFADPGLIEQALVNLILNAQDAIPGGGEIRISTRLATAKEGRVAELCVRDNGKGMDATTRKRIFEPFFTTKAEGRGLGLGLAMVHGSVQQQGGTVSVDSSPGQGAAFTLRFPASDAPAPAAADTHPPAPPVAAGKTVLLIEDDPMVRWAVGEMLEAEGYAVVKVEDPTSLPEHAATLGPTIDAIVCDVVMPGIRGSDLIREIRRRTPLTAPVLLISGFPAGDEGLDESQGFLQKPFTAGELRAALARTLAMGSAPEPRTTDSGN